VDGQPAPAYPAPPYELQVLGTVPPDMSFAGPDGTVRIADQFEVNDRLFNNDSVLHKVVYRFTPRIDSENGPACPGSERIVTIWVRPGIRYRKNLSDFHGYNISCYGKSDGFIWINTSGNFGPLSYSWAGPAGFESSGESVRRLEAGRYTVRITDINNCSVQDTVMLRAPGKLDMKMDLSVSMDGAFNINCADESTGSIMVSPLNNVGEVKYLWNDGNTGAFRSDLKAGEYRVIINDANNCRTDSMVRLTQPEKMKAEFEVSLPYCAEKPDGEVRLNVTGGIEGNEYKYLWSDNSTSRILSGIKAGVYEVKIGDMNGCSLKSAVLVNALHELCLIIPEAISPNNDLVNDVLNIGNADLYPRIEILIFNRWGQLLWKSEEGYPKPWDGRSNGRVLPVDSYHYVIDLHNGMKPIMGDITIVR
jgi:gliding motility-associated-like protein